MEYQAALQKDEILQFAATCMQLEGIALRKNKPEGKRQILGFLSQKQYAKKLNN